jgi:NDP-sugar pyrophosphorylase family protein
MYALVLAGGKGERLRPLTADRPKQMVLVGDKPLLEHQIEWMRREGITDVVLLCGYRHEALRDYFGDGGRWGLRISYSVEDQPLGRGGALKKGGALVPASEEIVIATNGDNILTQPLAPMIRLHRRSGATATLMLTRLMSPYGIVRVRGNRITGFVEKPPLPHWLSAGLYVLSHEFFAGLPDVGDHEDSLFPQLAGCGKLYAYKSTSYWKGIDTVKDLSEAAAYLAKAEL